MIWQHYLLVAIGGALGAVARVYLSGLVATLGFASFFPLGTFVVNILGSFCIGCAYVYLSATPHLTWLKFLLVGGFLGAFTTFSTYALDAFLLFEQKQSLIGMLYFLLSPIAAFVAVVGGILVSRYYFLA